MIYVPQAYRKYELLPYFMSADVEVVLYPPKMDLDIDALLPDGETVLPYLPSGGNLIFGYTSYEEYYAKLDGYISTFGTTDGKLNELGKMITNFKKGVQRMNIKDRWSVVRFISEDVDVNSFESDFIYGRHYYWACSVNPLKFEGIIADDGLPEYDTFDPKSTVWDKIRPSWQIVEDPTGIAARYLNK